MNSDSKDNSHHKNLKILLTLYYLIIIFVYGCIYYSKNGFNISYSNYLTNFSVAFLTVIFTPIVLIELFRLDKKFDNYKNSRNFGLSILAATTVLWTLYIIILSNIFDFTLPGFVNLLILILLFSHFSKNIIYTIDYKKVEIDSKVFLLSVWNSLLYGTKQNGKDLKNYNKSAITLDDIQKVKTNLNNVPLAELINLNHSIKNSNKLNLKTFLARYFIPTIPAFLNTKIISNFNWNLKSVFTLITTLIFTILFLYFYDKLSYNSKRRTLANILPAIIDEIIEKKTKINTSKKKQ